MKNFLVFIFLALASQNLLAAPCGPHSFTPSNEVKLTKTSLMIVTHPATLWDGRFSSKVGMDAAVQYAKNRQIPVIYLQGDDNPETYFFSDCSPTYWVNSYGGEFDFDLSSVNHVYSVGGHWELCQKNTQNDLMQAWSTKKNVDLTLTQVLDGLYAYGSYVWPGDPYYATFTKFMDIVSYRKPGEDWPKRKLNMLEMMGIIHHPKQEIEFLKRNLPPYENLPSDYEVVLWVNGKQIEVLKKGRRPKAPIFKIEFIDSLWESGYAPTFTQ